MKNNGYIGKISNVGSQIVKAPIKPAGKVEGGKTKKGNDLRSK